MKTSRATQCQSQDLEDHNQDLSTSAGEPFFDDLPLKDLYVDINDPGHIEKLKSWCQFEWTATFKRSFMYSNTMYYHSCCNSFSRRYFMKSSGHPMLQSCNVLKIIGFKTMESSEDLLRWLLQTIRENAKRGEKTLFPSVNRRHRDLQEIEEETAKDTEDHEFLKKRCHDLERELLEHKTLLKRFKSDHTKLLNSSRSWASKYQQLLEQQDPTTDYLMTPVKKVRLSNSDVLFYDES